ncbi:hypothetical protein ACFT9I_28350 [Streptomyces sp. NPDC057137]|uniref:hypothetical protein n=1 Tax=Streptomyces sp. NPDC057137 TaxID=3346030 RepID=UPI0036334E69
MSDATAGNEMAKGGSWELTDQQGGELAARWWQWALSAPDDHSPVLDETGEHAGWNQPHDLWFLAGTYGGRVVRRCDLPAGRPVFFPILNVQRPVVYVKQPLAMPVARAEAALNGAPLPLREFTSPTFRAGQYRRNAWGLWAAMTPLIAGQYVLEIKAAFVGGFWVDTTYHLNATTV